MGNQAVAYGGKIERKKYGHWQCLTVFISRGMTRKPEEIKGASSGKCSSIGANTSWKEEPTDFSSIPVQS